MSGEEVDVNAWVSKTGGLARIEQLIEDTPNKFFVEDNTSGMVESLIIIPPSFYERESKDLEKRGEEFLEEFKSIVKKKLDKPIDLKKLYYEQIDNPP